MYPNPLLYITDLHDLGGKPINVWVADYCDDKFRKFLTWQSQSKRQPNIRFPAHSLQEKAFMQITCTGGKRILRTSEEVLFAGLNSSEYQQLKIGEPKPEKNSGPRNSFLSTIPEVEKLAEFSGETIFKSEENGVVSPENSVHGRIQADEKYWNEP